MPVKTIVGFPHIFLRKVADYDSDGRLDRTEYGCFMHPEDCDHMRDIVVQATFYKIP